MKREDRHLLTVIRHFCERHGIRKTAFGKMAVNDFSFVERLESGRATREKMRERIYNFIEEYENGRH